MKILTISKRKKTILLLTIFLSLLFLTGEQLYISAEMSNELNDNEVSLLSLTPHSGFNITNNGNFTDYGFSGTGAPDDPFIIENYNITTAEENGIYITGTTLYFVIQNCYIDADYTGIYVTSVATNTTKIVNNTIVNNDGYGIRIGSTSYFQILKNNLTDNFNGIYTSSSPSGTFVNNTIVNTRRGIWFSSGTSSSLINNTFINNLWGIDLTLSHNSVILNNTFNNCQSGVWLSASDNLEISYNTCEYSSEYGFFISGGSVISLTFNRINNGYHGIYITENSDTATVINNTISNTSGTTLYLGACHDSILANNTLSYNYLGVDIVSSSNCIIEHNIFTMNERGNRISNCANLTIQNNYFYNDGLEFSVQNIAYYLTCTFANNKVNDRELGFFFNLISVNIQGIIYGQLILINCSETIITDQELYNTSTGISLFYCNDISIENSHSYNNNINGIYSSDSTNIAISNSLCYNNIESGILLKNSGGTVLSSNNCSYNTYGIKLIDSPSVVIFNNICEKNSLYGIFLEGRDLGSPRYVDGIKLAASDSCLITYNHLIENTEYGIYIGTDNNNIYNNTFIDNFLGSYGQAFDKGTGNYWYDIATSQGNYWSDWVSGSYSINGTAGSVDLYPFETPITPIIAEYNYQNLTVIIILVPLMLIGIILLKRKK